MKTYNIVRCASESISSAELVKHDSQHSATGASAYSEEDFDGYSWELEAVSLHDIGYMGWSPTVILPNEGDGRVPTEEDLSSAQWDEHWARKYAKLKTPFPAIIIDDRNEIWSGRHRARAAYLRGDGTIKAYVGRLL